MFSPVFATDDAIVAVVAEPEPGFSRTEDEGLDNLWRYDLRSRRWSRVTAFHASGDHWVAIRTPIVRDDGSIEFVRGEGTGDRDRGCPRSSSGGCPPSASPRRCATFPGRCTSPGCRTDVASGTSTTRRAGSGGSTRRHRRPRWWTSGAARPSSTLAPSRTPI